MPLFSDVQFVKPTIVSDLFNTISFFQTLYNSVIEEKITIEQVNTMGARLAKEAKVWCIFMSSPFLLWVRLRFGMSVSVHSSDTILIPKKL